MTIGEIVILLLVASGIAGFVTGGNILKSLGITLAMTIGGLILLAMLVQFL